MCVPVMIAAAMVAACTGDLRIGGVPTDELWPDDVGQSELNQTLDLRDRDEGNAYGLPREGELGIADLIAAYPQGTRATIFVGESDRSTLTDCRGGAPLVIDELPMTIEVVVTHHPRRFMKPEVCFQDERYWGTYTVEDDTGGITVLRGERTANFTFGDRALLTVRALTWTFSLDQDTRAVLVADLQPLTATATDDFERPVLFSKLDRGFTADDATEVKQVEGWVFQSPSNDNFNEMIMTQTAIDVEATALPLEGPLLTCVRTCESTCRSRCDDGTLCFEICEDLCLDSTDIPAADEIPACWRVSMDIDLGRRGFSPEVGSHLRATGPIVNNFDRQMWIYTPAQIEFLD